MPPLKSRKLKKHLPLLTPPEEWFLEEKPKKSYLPLTLLFQSWNNTGKRWQKFQKECDFLTWSIQNFVKKVKIL